LKGITLKTPRILPILALSFAGTMLFAGCAATGAATPEESPTTSASASEKVPTPIELVQKTDPDNLGEGLVYTKISKNKAGQYVELGADKESDFATFDPTLWTSTGKSWTEADMAKAQLTAVDFVFVDILSGPAIGGNKEDIAAQMEGFSKRLTKSDQDRGGAKEWASLFDGPVSENGLVVWAEPSLNYFSGYEIYQAKDSSRFLNPTVKLTSANSYDKGDFLDSSKSETEIDGATVTVEAYVDLKLTKDKTSYSKPVQVTYDVFFMKDKGVIGVHGASLTSGPTENEPMTANF